MAGLYDSKGSGKKQNLTGEKKTDNVYRTALTHINVFARWFCVFFEQDWAQEQEYGCSEMKRIASELPDLLKSAQSGGAQDGGGADSVRENGEKEENGYECYRISTALTDEYGISGAEALAITMPALCKYLIGAHCGRLAEFARRVWNVPAAGMTDSAAAQEGIARFQDFICRCGLAATLREYGIRHVDSARLAKRVEAIPVPKPHPGMIRLDPDAVRSVCELARG